MELYTSITHSFSQSVYAEELWCVRTSLGTTLSLLFFSHPVVSDSLRPHGLQHARPPCPSPSPGVKPSSSIVLSSHLILWHPLLLLPLIFPNIWDFSNESCVHIRWPKYWNFSFSVSPFSEYSGLITLKIDWFDLLAVQGTFRSLLQHHSSKSSILWRSAFYTVRFSQPLGRP